MNALDFFKLVLPSTGRYCIAGIHQSTEQIRQKFVDTLEDAVQAVEDIKNQDFVNCYFALAAFTDSKRTGSSAHHLRSFFVDLDTKDVGGIKGYASKEDALQSLQIFCKVMGFPRPIVNDSGGGLHAYWPFTEDVEREEWKVYANKFKQLCYYHQLNTDPTVPTDVARILRVPGTVHQKSTNIVKTLVKGKATDFQKLKEIIDAKFLEMPFELQAQAQPKRQLTAEEKAVLGYDDTENNFQQILDVSLAGIGCNQIKDCFENRTTLDEPRWRAILATAQICNDRDKMIHIVSEGHPEYDPAAAEAKANGTNGSYRCSTWETLNPKGCEGCKKRGRISNPIQLGKVLKAPEPITESFPVETQKPIPQENANEINELAGVDPAGMETSELPTAPAHIQENLFPDLPEAYFKPFERGPNGGIYVQTIEKGKDGKILATGVVRVYANDIYVVKLTQDGDSFNALIRVFLPHDGVKEFYVPLQMLASPEKCKGVLNSNGVVAPRDDMDKLLAYMTKWIQYLQAMRQAERLHQHFGWTDELDSFVWGTTEFNNKGETLVSPPSARTRELSNYMTQKGTFEEWQKAFNNLNAPGFEVHAFAALTGFGSPLMALTDYTGAVLSFQNKNPGTGKTLALKMALSLWGQPENLLVTATTTNGLYERMAVMNSLPLALDENTNMSGMAVSDMIYNAAHGKGKIRLEGSANVERKNQGKWRLIPMTSANTSTYQRLDGAKADTLAEKMRVIELKMTKPDSMSNVYARDHLNQINDNYGHAGPTFIKYVVTHQGEVEAVINKWMIRLDTDFGNETEYRYWSYTLSAIFAGAEVSKKMGLHSLDIERVYKRVLKEAKGTYKELIDSRVAPYDLFTNFYADNFNNMLIIKGSDSLRGHKVAPTATPRGSLVMRYEPDTLELAVRKQSFDEYCQERSVNIVDMKDSLSKQGILKEVRRKRMDKGWQNTIGEGDKNINVMCYILTLDINKLKHPETEDEGA